MKHPLNPLELEMLIQTYYRADGPEHRPSHSEAHQEAGNRLVKADVCAWTAGKPYTLRCTERGEFYIRHLLSIPYPVDKQAFVIPEKQS